MVHLSRGGKDAVVIREFDLVQKQFVKNGFRLFNEAKSRVAWLDKNRLLVATDFGEGTLTDSGYPRVVKLWRRGQNLKDAKVVFEGGKSDVLISPYVLRHGHDHAVLVVQSEGHNNRTHWLYKKGELEKMPIPRTVSINGLFKGAFIMFVRDPWPASDKIIAPGSVVALDPSLSHGAKGDVKNHIQVLYSPNNKSAVREIAVTKNRVLIGVLENIRGRIFEVQVSRSKPLGFAVAPKSKKSKTGPQAALAPNFTPASPMVEFSAYTHWSLEASSASSEDFVVSNSDFLHPSTLYLYSSRENRSSKIKSLQPYFESHGMVAEQRWATSKDGTRVPYFLVGQKVQIQSGKAPTLLYGYGGFQHSLTPGHSPLLGQLWLAKGGLYVEANIRGGGEFGPEWHKAALKTNRHKAYEDFIAVAEDLIASKTTTADRLAIEGASNGGLLMGAVMTQRPELFKAVIAGVPLLDMIRYSKLLAGASWIGEYGDPDNAEERGYLLSYSPYHNIEHAAQKKYPALFLYTSTKDDRVHPGHARKMAAKMLQYGHENVLYYENKKGGHAAASGLKQLAKLSALKYEFLFQLVKD